MSIHRVKLKPLTEELFRPYGTLLAMPMKPDEKTVYSEGFTFFRNRTTFQCDDGKLGIGISHILKKPFRAGSMERHLTTDELNVPLDGDMVAIFAKPKTTDILEIPNYEEVDAFILRQGQAVVIDKGVWHWCPMPVEHDTAMLCSLCHDLLDYDDLIIRGFHDDMIIEIAMEANG